MRSCGDCQLCCELLPVPPIDKPANTRCRHQHYSKGCKIYGHRPFPCEVWSCRWLAGDDTRDLRRPDRVGYCIDVMPDFIRTEDPETGNKQTVQVVQIWVDPKRPHAHRDPALRAYLLRRAAEQIIGLVRLGSHKGLILAPPTLTREGKWLEIPANTDGTEHSWDEVKAALGGQS